jgi:hypothetical protein
MEFDTEQLPEAERQDAFVMVAHAAMLGKFTREFASALSLIQYSETLSAGIAKDHQGYTSSTIDNWKLIAARDAIMTMYHFCSSIRHIKSIKAPTFKSMIDQSKIDEADRIVRANFPRYRELRDAVSHVSDLMKNASKLVDNSVDGRSFVFGAISGRDFSITIGKAHLTVRLDHVLLNCMSRACKLIVEAVMHSGIIQHK